jgi:membrane protein DedA with SNARE-associated domain
MITEQKLDAAERWTARFGAYGVFAARLLPVIRHLIGIPVGIVRMPFGRFSVVTLVGSAAWTAVLCWLGVTAGHDQALLAGDLHRITLWLVAVLGGLGILYVLFVRRPMRRR